MVILDYFFTVQFSLALIDPKWEIEKNPEKWKENSEEQIGKRFNRTIGVIDNADTYNYQDKQV